MRVIVSFEVDGPKTQRSFVDQLIESTARSRESELSAAFDDGVIATYLHLSTDGKRALSYVEFTDESAHEALLRSRMREGGPVRRFVAQVPGVRSLSFVRYRVYDRFAAAHDHGLQLREHHQWPRPLRPGRALVNQSDA